VADNLIQIVDLVVLVLTLTLIAYALMSFLPLDPWHPVRRALTDLIEPVLRPIRNLIPPVGMIDLSVMVALIALRVVGELLKAMIRSAF
jgi:YggT family protein